MHATDISSMALQTPGKNDLLRSINFSRPKLVIFDCDGVLIQSEEITLSVLAKLVNGYLRTVGDGRHISPGQATNLYRGRKISECIEDVFRQFGIAAPRNFEESVRAEALVAYKTELKATQGVAALLEKLTIPFCVASSAPIHKIEHCLALTGLDRYFDQIFSCYEIKKWKPDPLVFQVACAHFNVHPSQALVIEDSVPGVMAASAAKIPVLGFAPMNRHAELTQHGAITFTDMDQLLEILI